MNSRSVGYARAADEIGGGFLGLEQIQTMTRHLLEEETDPVPPCLRCASAFLAEACAGDFLDELDELSVSRGRLKQLVTGLGSGSL